VRLVIRIGGSVVASPFNPTLMNEYVKLLERLRAQEHVVATVVGGGSLSRDLIEIARAMGLSEAAQDEVAISVSRLMAQLLALRLGRLGALTVPTTVGQAAELLEKGKVVVMGGLKPGMTTDAVAALLAERVKADLLVKATNVNGIFTKDPKRYSDAEKIDCLGFDDLFGFFEKEEHEVGIHQVLDPEAVRILLRSRIRTVVVNGFRPENVLMAVKGEKVGTLIS